MLKNHWFLLVFGASWNSSPDLPGSSRIFPDLLDLVHQLRLGTSLPRAPGFKMLKNHWFLLVFGASRNSSQVHFDPSMRDWGNFVDDQYDFDQNYISVGRLGPVGG